MTPAGQSNDSARVLRDFVYAPKRLVFILVRKKERKKG